MSYLDLPVSEVQMLLDSLRKGGLTHEMAKDLMRDPFKAHLWVRQLSGVTAELKAAEAAYITSWWLPPTKQIEAVSEFLKRHGKRQVGFRISDIPPVPNFTPLTPTEVLMLTVTLPDMEECSSLERTVAAWWDTITPPSDYYKGEPLSPLVLEKMHYVSSDAGEPGIRWVGFDPNMSSRGKAPKWLDEHMEAPDVMLAGVEVLMAAALFPAFMRVFHGSGMGPKNVTFMSGLRYEGEDWLEVCAPFILQPRDGYAPYLAFMFDSAVAVSSVSVSPTIRKL